MSSDYPKSPKEAVGYILKRVWQVMKNKSKSDRRVGEDRRVPDEKYIGEMPDYWKTVKQRARGANGHDKKDKSTTAADVLRGDKDRRKVEPRRGDDSDRISTRATAITGAVGVPLGTAAGVLQRNENKKTTEQKIPKKATPTFDEQLESIYQEFKGSKLKRIQ